MRTAALVAILLTASSVRAQEQISPPMETVPVERAMDQLSNDYTVYLDSSPSRFAMSMTGNSAQFSLQGRTLSGYSMEMSAGYAFHSRLKANLAVEQALGAQGGISIMYTGLRTFLSYALKGSYMEESSVLNVNGRPALGTKTTSESTFGVDIGLDQYILNGSNSVVPATGASTALRYERDLWGVRVLAVARYGFILVSNNTGSTISAGGGISYRF